MVSDIKSVRNKRALEYLAARGINLKEADKLGLQFVTSTHLQELGYNEYITNSVEQAILMPVFDFMGEDTGSSGARLFHHENTGASFGIDTKEQAKYISPKGQTMHLHFPRNGKWGGLQRGDAVYICESYIKASIACKLGYHAVGVSGVWGWRSKQGRRGIIDGLGDIPWHDLALRPIVCFDSNVDESNQQLWPSVRRLLTYLNVTYDVTGGIVILPKDDDGDDWGLDDYYIALGADAAKEYLAGDPLEVPPDLNTVIEDFNEDVCYINELDKVVRLRDLKIQTNEDFNSHYADRWVNIPNADGDIQRRQLHKIWFTHPNRRRAERVVYEPGEGHTDDAVNLWRGMGTSPVEGDIGWWHEWLDLVIPDQEERDWFESWLAWPIQNLGGKMTTSVFLYGPSGVGKGWLAQMMTKIYSYHNCAAVELSDFVNDFNSEWSAGQFLIIEEAEDIRDSSRVYTKLKDLITNPRVKYKKKFIDSTLITNHLNIMLQGNNLGALGKIDTFDRRLAILSMDREGCKEIANKVEYWESMFSYIDDGVGAEALHNHLLGRTLGSFSPTGAAPHTSAKRDAIELGMSAYEAFAEGVVHDPDSVLPEEVNGPYMTTKELYYFMFEGSIPWYELGEREHQSRINAFSKALLNAGLTKASDGKNVKNPYTGKPGVVWQIKVPPTGLKQSHSDMMREKWREELYVVGGGKF